jgi:hypothetical protein
MYALGGIQTESERLQIHGLDRAATGIGQFHYTA